MNFQRARRPIDPVFRAIGPAAPARPILLLHSGRFHRRWAGRSLLAQPRAWYRHTADRRSQLVGQGDFNPPDLDWTGELWTDLRNLLHHPDLPGSWIGYFSYDLGRIIEPGKLASPTPSPWPLVELGYCPRIETFTPPQAEPVEDPPPTPGDLPDNLTADFTRAQYEAAVARALEHIAAGDVFQVNLAQRFTAQHAGSPRRLYEKLAAVSPAWYGAYLELPPFSGCPACTEQGRSEGALPGDRALLSTSPELFLQVKDRHVITRPIKGTRPTGATHFSESAPDPNYLELLHSEKDQAELAMIVDLLRNDLGRVCSYGSVRVTNPRQIETHPTVHHTTATIEGDLHQSKDLVDLLKATLPGGSITGAPKVRAMQIIDDLEPVRRGPYCGCIGLISKDELCLNIAIRTMLLERDEGTKGQRGEANPKSEIRNPKWNVSFSVGGGIVADSDPRAEYDETLTKARAILRALA